MERATRDSWEPPSLNWAGWEQLIRTNGITLDRPRYTRHPSYPDIIYPLDYGFVNQTKSGDGQEVDIFVGTADTGLVGAIWTRDFRKGDRECKLLLDCTPQEVYLTNGFLNFDRTLMEGVLVMRKPMAELWAGTQVPSPRNHPSP